jgi:hypothetical protein
MGVTEIMQLAQLGITVPILVMLWKSYIKKDTKSYAREKEHIDDIKAIHESTTELVSEVTAALVSKNHTDDKMSQALDKLAERLRRLEDTLKEKL